MRIGFFTDTFLPQKNGVVTSLLSFGAELEKRGHEVHVFCPKTNVRHMEGMEVHSYPAVSFRRYPEFKIAVPQGRDRAPKLDLVHTHSPFTMGFFGWRVAKFQKIPRVSTFHTLLSEYYQYVSRVGKPVLKLVSWRFCRAFYKRHKKLITPSAALKRLLREHGIKKPIEVIPTGIDIKALHPIDKKTARRKLGLEDERIFLCLGRVSYEKNLDLVIRAMTEVDGKLLLVGRGPATGKLKKLVDKKHLRKRVSFKGFVPEKLKPLYCSAADALVIASKSETQGLVVAEAMACGTPVIGANALAIPEVVRNGENGYLFKPENIGSLSALMQKFEPSEGMRKNARKTAESYSIEKCTTKLEEFYNGLQVIY
ncbi:MAG: glycosyltransferase [Candidatus Hadarchaeota archaeon]